MSKTVIEKHIHVWTEKKLLGIPFRYCKCGRLERSLYGSGWQEYPQIMKNEYTGEVFESIGYRCVNDFEMHPIPEYPSLNTPLRTCWMCGKTVPYEELAIHQSEWPEEFVDMCWDCYRGRNTEWKKGRWKCYLGFHKWHPILDNPKVCYRCGKNKGRH